MVQSVPEWDFQQWTVSQRLELIGAIWDSIPDAVEHPAMPEWHREELERRIAEADAAPDAGLPWEQVQAQLRSHP